MSKGTKLCAAIYVRQSVREDQGIAQQIAECEAKAKAEGWTVYRIYNDNQTSATKDRGEGTEWARMLADIDAGHVQVVIVAAVDRLMRRLVDVLEVRPPRRDVRVVIANGSIDTGDAGGMGAFILGLFVLVAEQEIQRKEARTVPYRAARREAGHPAPGLVPFGYSWVPKLQRDARGTRYEVVPGEAAVLRFMSRELLGGSSLGGIVAALNAGEARDERGALLGESSRTTRAGKRWITTTARRLLLSPFPAALLPPKMPEGEHYNAARVDMSRCTPGAWEPILTEDAVMAARAILLKPSRLTHDGDTRAKHLLSGIGRCAVCGGPIRSAQVKTTTPDPQRAYRCTKGCFVRGAAIIEAYVTEAVVTLLSTPGLLQWVPDDGADIDTLRARRVALQSDRDDAETLYAEGAISAATLRAKTGKLDPEIQAVDAALAAVLQADPLAEIVTSDDVRGMWERITPARRRAILGALVHHVHVGRVGKGVRVLTVEAAEGTVSMGWKRTEHRVSLTRARLVSTGRPLVPMEAREAIATALSA
ncbi:recombinase family protein [Microbacterium sp.]|uniref:recombinase family protein n=1 Tax=Microbacterium sp. TaxID=51671 RepID=UPI0039E3508E